MSMLIARKSSDQSHLACSRIDPRRESSYGLLVGSHNREKSLRPPGDNGRRSATVDDQIGLSRPLAADKSARVFVYEQRLPMPSLCNDFASWTSFLLAVDMVRYKSTPSMVKNSSALSGMFSVTASLPYSSLVNSTLGVCMSTQTHSLVSFRAMKQVCKRS